MDRNPLTADGETMRKRSFFIILLGLLLLPGLASAHGSRHASRVQWSLSFGTGYYAPYYRSHYYGPGWGGYWAGPSVIYSAPIYTPPPVVIQQSPPVYIEKPAASTDAPAAGWWYYCAPTRSYYPYVNDCAEAWQRVAPVPPGAAGGQP